MSIQQKNPKTLTTLGILGCGYVARRLLQRFNCHPNSWYTIHQSEHQLAFEPIKFSLDDPLTWAALPEYADCLVFSIPPLYQQRDQEQQRVEAWCEWMKNHRPHIQRLIYFSTTGVYSEAAKHYDEQSETEPSTIRGFLRLDTEQILNRYFDTVSLRCGGIYGPDSNMVEKALKGQPLFRGNKRMYRIHVDDLVGVIGVLVEQMNKPDAKGGSRCFNLVDDQAICQDEIVDWLMAQDKFSQKLNIRDKRLDHHNPEGQRLISNHALFEQLGYQLKYPGYQQGLGSLLG